MITKHELIKSSAYLSALISSAFIISRGLKYLQKNFKKKSNSLLIGIYGLSIVALSFIFYYSDAIVYKTIAFITYSDISYNSKSIDKELSDIKDLPVIADDKDADLKEVYISFHFKVNSITNWNNIFQTAALNNGLRMELAAPSTLGLIIKTKNSPGFRGLILTDSLDLDKWHEINLALTKDKNIKIILDGKTINISDINFDYEISDISVGTGLSKSRKFDGEITDFRIDYKAYRKRETLIICVSVLEIIMVMLLLLIPYYILSANNHKKYEL